MLPLRMNDYGERCKEQTADNGEDSTQDQDVNEDVYIFYSDKNLRPANMDVSPGRQYANIVSHINPDLLPQAHMNKHVLPSGSFNFTMPQDSGRLKAHKYSSGAVARIDGLVFAQT